MLFPSSLRSRAARAKAAATSLASNTADPAQASGRAAEARRVLLQRITDFVIQHDLVASAHNLALICAGLSGSHPELAQALAAREMAGEPIDQRWLDTLARIDHDGTARMAELETLMDKLELALSRFSQTARTAHTETSEHRGAIGGQIAAMGAPANIAQVLDLSRAMLARIEQVEAAMARSEAETELLRENLAKARIEADVDHLTKLPNRRAFERLLLSAATEARAKGEPLSLAFCDLDHFKEINDRHGHEAGDRVLCTMAAGLIEYAGDGLFVARHGGEEFVLLFYGLDKEAARQRVDTLRSAQAARHLINRENGEPFGRITFSSGVAEVTEDPDTRSALVRADAALYRAKQEGRNRVVVG